MRLEIRPHWLCKAQPQAISPSILPPQSPEALIPDTLYPTPYTLHPTPYTLHPTPYTLHPTPYTLHLTPYTLHPTPYTRPPPTFLCFGGRALSETLRGSPRRATVQASTGRVCIILYCPKPHVIRSCIGGPLGGPLGAPWVPEPPSAGLWGPGRFVVRIAFRPCLPGLSPFAPTHAVHARVEVSKGREC